MNSKHWTYGGSAVLTNNFARLTPINPQTSGWMKSAIAIPGNTWEVQVDISIVTSSYSQIGNGIAIHFLDQETDIPDFNPLFEPGDFFAADPSRKGFSVVYSTTNAQGNLDPAVFVDDNMEGSQRDYGQNYRNFKSLKSRKKSSCNFNFSYRQKPFKLIIRVFGSDVFVYIRSTKLGKEVVDYCLEVNLSKKFDNSTFIAIGASNGLKMGSKVEVKGVMINHNTKNNKKTENTQAFLEKARLKIEDRPMMKSPTKMKRFFWFCMVLSGMVLFLETIWEMSLFRHIINDKTSPHQTLSIVNDVTPHTSILFLIVFALQLLSFNVLICLVLTPICVWKVLRLAKSRFVIKPEDYDYNSSCHQYFVWLMLSSLLYSVFVVQSAGRLMSF